MNLKHDDWGVFVRADTFYQAYRRPNYNDAPGTVNQSGQYNNFTSDARYWSGGHTTLLAAYAYNTFKIGSTSLNVKVGESHGAKACSSRTSPAHRPSDATKSYMAGAEVKDILLPVPQISTQWQITPNFSLLGYYQFSYQQNRLTAPGTYWSYSDVTAPARSSSSARAG